MLGTGFPTGVRPRRESRIPAAMGYRLPDEDLDDEEDALPVPLGPEERAWLAALERVTGKSAAQLVASMIQAIRVDDEAAHSVH